MKITGLEKQKKNENRYNLYVDNKFFLGVDENVIIKHRLVTGMEVEESYLNNVIRTEELNKSINVACNYLGFKQRSEKEVRDKLKLKEFDEEIIDDTIEFLNKYGYLNDYNYGKALISEKQNFKKAGKNLLKQELFKKGIDKELITELIEESFDYDEEYDRAYKLAKKKYNSIRNEDKNSIYRKISSLLARKGYSFDIINSILKELNS